MKPPNQAQVVSMVAFFTFWGLAISWLIHMDSELKKQYYTVEIIGFDSPNFQDATSPPSFNLTIRVDNRYKHDMYIKDWRFAVRLDGVPLGRGSFPDDLTVHSMSNTTVTGTTSSALVGMGKEASNGKSMEDLELQVDMWFDVFEPDIGISGNAYAWLWCPARIGDHSAPSRCRERYAG